MPSSHTRLARRPCQRDLQVATSAANAKSDVIYGDPVAIGARLMALPALDTESLCLARLRLLMRLAM